MLLFGQRCRGRWFPAAGVVLLLAFLLAARPLRADPVAKLAAEHYRYAELLLKDLDSVPAAELGPEQYLLVIDAFQKVHRTSPASSYCDDALLQAAHLYREMIGRFGPKPYRDKAIDAYQSVIREYPHSTLLDAARQAISQIEKGAPAPKRQRQPAAQEEEETQPLVSRSSPAEDSGSLAETARSEAGIPADPAGGGEDSVDAVVSRSASKDGSGESAVAMLSSRSLAAPISDTTKDVQRRNQLARLQGIRFWSNPECTRVVVEVDERVEFSYDQLLHPKRLFFDLQETKLGDQLAQEAAIEVGDSFVKRIRVAQFRRRSTRVVFDLERALYFDVAWLANPPRLVIEVRDRDEAVMLARAGSPAAASVQETVRPAGAELAGKIDTIASLKPDATAKSPEPSFARALDAHGSGPTAAASDQPARPTAATEKRSEPAKTAATERASERKTAKTPPASKQPVAAGSRTAARAAESHPSPQPIPPAASDTAEKTAAKAAEPQERAGEAETADVELAKVTPPSDDNLPAPRAATANAKGQRNLIRALGLKVGRVVIDAGHGGRDTGTIGSSGLREKDLVLDVAHRLGKLIEEGLGSEVLYTRGDDQFVSLKERTKLANEAKADLFISIHANSSGSRRVRGVETYYLNFTTDSWALTVASRENAASDRSVHELQDLLSKIALKEKIEESREFATRIQSSLFDGLSEDTKGLANRGVRKAPFMVLIGAKMPAVLAEIGFISNTQTEKLLKTSPYRQKVANHLYQGMLSYSESLGTISMASSATPASKVE